MFAVPTTVNVNCCVCDAINDCVEGLIVTTTTTARVTALELPPPGAGVTIVTWNAAALANKVEGTTAVSSLELVKVVVNEVTPSLTVDCRLRPIPNTWIVVSGLPALISDGETVLIVGAGLTTSTEAEPERDGSATLVALTVTVFGEGGIAGAV